MTDYGHREYTLDEKVEKVKSQLLNGEIYGQFNQALKERSSRGHFAEITFIGINP